MTGPELYKRALETIAARASGHQSYQRRNFVGEIQMQGQEADLRALPVDMSGWAPLQDSSGNFYAMVGSTAIGNGDTIGPGQ